MNDMTPVIPTTATSTSPFTKAEDDLTALYSQAEEGGAGQSQTADFTLHSTQAAAEESSTCDDEESERERAYWQERKDRREEKKLRCKLANLKRTL